MDVRFEMLAGGVGRLTLEGGKANVLDRPDFCDPAELAAFLERPDLKALLVRGAGRHFCAGADLASLERQKGDRAAFLAALGRGKALLDALDRATVPVLAAVRGSCLGAGFELALACHFRFAAPHALFGFPESQHGFIPGLGGSVFGQDRLGRPGLAELVLGGRCVLGEEAAGHGLVDRVVDPAGLEDAALGFLAELTARHDPFLIRQAMGAIQDGRFLPRDQALDREGQRFFELIQRADVDA